MKKCPICNSTRYKENLFTGDKNCPKCGYTNKKSRYKELISKSGNKWENKWMR